LKQGKGGLELLLVTSYLAFFFLTLSFTFLSLWLPVFISVSYGVTLPEIGKPCSINRQRR
jgi:hypothetical protein